MSQRFYWALEVEQEYHGWTVVAKSPTITPVAVEKRRREARDDRPYRLVELLVDAETGEARRLREAA